VQSTDDELEAFGWGDDTATEDEEDDLDWGDALDGSSDDADDEETVPHMNASTDGDTAPEAPGDGAPFATPAPPPTAVDIATVSPGDSGGEADEWEQALAEGDEFYEDEAPPPLGDADVGDLGLDHDGSADLDSGGGGAAGSLAVEPPDPHTPSAKKQGEDSGPIDLSKFASRRHDQIEDDAGTSVWFKLTVFLMLSLGGLAAGAFFYLAAQQPPNPLQAPAGGAQPLPPRVDDPAYPLGLKRPKAAKVAPIAKPLPPPIGAGDDADPTDGGADDDAPPVPVDIAKEATGAAVLDDLPPADSVAAQLASRKQGAALPPDKASRKLHAKHFKRAEKLRKRGKLDAAVEEYTQAMAHRPGHVPTLVGLGNAYFDLGRAGDARRVLAQAIKASPKNGQAWLVYGMVLQEEGETNAAIKAYRRFLEFEPEDKYAGEVGSILQTLETE
jgi:tetratricopeptide (TPR) repeat protein